MKLSLVFVACIVPVIVLLVVNLLTARLWRKSTKKINVDRATSPFIASVSILAIAIPLVANLLLQATKSHSASWALGSLLAGLTFAIISLIAGGYLIYKILLKSNGNDLEISGDPSSPTAWIPRVMSVQFIGMILFLITSFIGFLGALFAGSSPSAKSIDLNSRYTINKNLPRLNSTREDILQAWGAADSVSSSWISYQNDDSRVIFFFQNGKLHQWYGQN